MNAAGLTCEIFRSIALEVERAYPAEACGLIFVSAGGDLRWVPIPNVAGTEAAEPLGERGLLDGYAMDPGVLLLTLTAAEADGARLVAIVHSHVEVGADFSTEDARAAVGGGDQPLWPEVAYLVVSCRAGKVDGARLYRWDTAARTFCPSQVEYAQAAAILG